MFGRGFICLSLQNNSFLCKSRFLFSLYLSTCGERQNDRFCPRVHSQPSSGLTTLKNPHLVSSFLKDSGFSDAQLEKILQSSPKLLSSNLDKTIKPRFEIFRDFGFSDDETVEIISRDPWILGCSMNKLVPSLNVLKDLLGSTTDVATHLKICGWYLRVDLGDNLIPNIQLLKSYGITMDKISWFMRYFPRLLLQKPENMKKFVEKAEDMGADRSSVTFYRAIQVVGSMSDQNLKLKVEAFRNLGFSQDDILRAFRTQPQVFNVSVEKIEKVKEVLLATGKYNMSCIINNPVSLSRSVEKRYKPRLQVLGILEEKELIKKWPSFARLSTMTDGKFFDTFISPYLSEVGAHSGKGEMNAAQIRIELLAKQHAKV